MISMISATAEIINPHEAITKTPETDQKSENQNYFFFNFVNFITEWVRRSWWREHSRQALSLGKSTILKIENVVYN